MSCLPLSRERCLNRQKESSACVEVANNVPPTNSASASLSDSKGKGLMKDAMVVSVLMMLSFVTSSSEHSAPRY